MIEDLPGPAGPGSCVVVWLLSRFIAYPSYVKCSTIHTICKDILSLCVIFLNPLARLDLLDTLGT